MNVKLSKDDQIKRLTTLRGFAALLVVVDHFFYDEDIVKLDWAPFIGHLGVLLFFVLSGFLMGYLYLRLAPQLSSILRFAVSRFARVYPLFLLVLVICYIGKNSVLDPYTPFPIQSEANLFLHAITLRGSSILWTIPTEIHFYVAFVAIWIFLAKLNCDPKWPLIALLIVTLTYDPRLSEISVHGISIAFRLPTYLPYFLLGTLFSCYFPTTRIRFRLNGMQVVLISASLSCALYFAVGGTSGTGSLTDRFLWLVLVGFIFYILVFHCSDEGKWMFNRLGKFFGDRSYSLYLLHLFALQAVIPFTNQQNMYYLFPVYVALAIALSIVSYRYFEQPTRVFINGRANSFLATGFKTSLK